MTEEQKRNTKVVFYVMNELNERLNKHHYLLTDNILDGLFSLTITSEYSLLLLSFHGRDLIHQH